MQKYEVSNWTNEYCEQMYPINVERVYFVDMVSKKLNNGCLQISCMTTDGYYSIVHKCYQSKKGRYTIWGKHRIYEGYSGSIELIGVPLHIKDAIQSCADHYGSIVD